MVGPHLRVQPGTLVPAEAHNRLVDELMAVQNIAVGMFLQGGMGPRGLEIGVDVPSLRAWILAMIEEEIDSRSGVSFWAQITATSAAGDNKWTYEFTQVQQTDVGYGAGHWGVVEGGHSGSARNTAEIINSDAGVQGTGVDVDNLATVAPGMEHQPIPVGVVVRIYAVTLVDDWQYWFTLPNGIDGTCEASQ